MELQGELVFGFEQNERWNAYRFCHEEFRKAMKTDSAKNDYDYLALHLQAFLASWGMIVRDSILMKRNYKCLIHPLKEIFEFADANKILMDVDPYSPEFDRDEYIRLLLELKDKVKNSLVKDGRSPTDALISKMLLGTLSCVVAFDGKVRTRLGVSGINQGALNKVCDCFKKEKEKIFKQRYIMEQKSGWQVPMMGVLDNMLWNAIKQ